MFWLPMAIGAGIGAMTNKNPLRGAAIGGGLGAAGGGLLGASGEAGLLGNIGTAAKYGTNIGSEQTAMLAEQEAGMGGGLLDTANKAEAMLRPIGSAANSASSVYGLYGMMHPQQQVVQPQASPMIQSGGGPNGLAALAGQSQQLEQQRMAQEMQRRARQRQLISGIGGGNGLA